MATAPKKPAPATSVAPGRSTEPPLGPPCEVCGRVGGGTELCAMMEPPVPSKPLGMCFDCHAAIVTEVDVPPTSDAD